MLLPRVVLAVALVTCLGAKCGGPFAALVIDLPAEDALVDDPTVFTSARLATSFDAFTTQVQIDGVDLIGALGLTPPFTDESGVVVVGAQVVTISGFTFPTVPNPRVIEFAATGLDPGPHEVAVAAVKIGGGLVVRTRAFDRIGLLGFAVADVTAAGLPGGPRTAGSEGVLANASLGGAFAAPPVPFAGGGEVRPGLIHAAEARIAGGSPP